ncbi:MAG: phosphotransferase [Demequina sp.]
MTFDADGTTLPDITDELVASLVATQFPDLAGLDVGRHFALEDHVAVRVGDHHGVVFPTDARLDTYFARAAAILAPHTPHWTFPWSGPVRTGQPALGFPYHWVVIPWISASTAAYVPLKPAVAPELGRALGEVHVTAPPDAPTSCEGAQALTHMHDDWGVLLDSAALTTDRTGHHLDVDGVRARWDNGLSAGPSPHWTWIHGNVEPRSVMSDQGNFAAVILWHCFGAGNPEYDLACVSLLFPTQAHEDLYRGYGDLDSSSRARIQAMSLFVALRHINGTDPYRARHAWQRLVEWGLA